MDRSGAGSACSGFVGTDQPGGTLVELAWSAVDLQAEAERVMAACQAPGEKPAELARRGRAVVGGYFELREAVRSRPESPAADALARLLNYHQQVVEQSLLFAFGVPGPRDRRELARQFSPTLGPPAAELRELVVHLWLEAPAVR